jgi:3'-5' exoribonuclease
MELSCVEDFKVGQSISGFYLCKEKYLKKTRLGDSYIDLILQDVTGKVRAKVWNHANHFSNKFTKDDVVAVKGSIVEFNNSYEINIDSINAIRSRSYIDYGYSNKLIIGDEPKDFKRNKKYIESRIKRIPGLYSKILTRIYHLYNSKIEKVPFNNENFFIRGGLFRYTYCLLNIYDSIRAYYTDIDSDKLVTCIMIMNIGYIDYYNDDLFTVSERAKELNLNILGINLLSKVLVNYKSITDEDRDFLKRCIVFDKNRYDKNISFAKHLISLGKINNI